MTPASIRISWLLCLTCLFLADTARGEVTIDLWYGQHQRFGHLGGHPQRWINVLGSVAPANSVQSVTYRLNDREARSLSFREDKKRIARDGDFNIEILRSELMAGDNTVTIEATSTDGVSTRSEVVVEYVPQASGWPLPYEIDWQSGKQIQDFAQVTDGKWELTSDGVRSVERYYDRVIAFGDETWRDYEVSTSVIVHALTPPKVDPNTTGVTHAAIALRWPGHDADGKQPSVKWFPLGATAEFRLGGELKQCRWRIFDGQQAHVESKRRRQLQFETKYAMKHRVETLADGSSQYRTKLWLAGEAEPDTWDLVRLEPKDNVPNGSALLLAHHSDVTFGNVKVIPTEYPGP